MPALRSAGGPVTAESALTPPYATWIADAVGAQFHGEPASTCGACVMCRPSPAELAPQFDPQLKCCTYWPNLPNFLVGRVLRDGGEGARRLEGLIRRRVGLTPFGLEAPPAYEREFATVATRFGQAPELLCPLYQDGACTIWAHRNSMCQTYFCRSDQGVPGQARWRELTLLLMYVEEQLAVSAATRRLSHAAFFQLGFDAKGTRGRVSRRSLGGRVDDDGVVPEELHAALFGPWAGRELEFFLDCAREVDGLGWDGVRERLGHGLTVMVGRLQAGLDTPPPTEVRRPRLGVELVFAPMDDGVACQPLVLEIRSPSPIEDGLHLTAPGERKRSAELVREHVRSAAFEGRSPRGPMSDVEVHDVG